MAEEVLSREAKFVVHVPTKDANTPDVHLVKEFTTFKDGTTSKTIRIVKDYKRSYWTTKKSKRNHEQKKEYENLDNLLEHKCTQSDLRMNVARALDKPWSREQYKALANSPYLYGSDIPAASMIKRHYSKVYPCNMSPYEVCAFDTETDVLYGTGDVIIATTAYKNNVLVVLNKSFVSGLANPLDQIQVAVRKHIGEQIEKDSLNIIYHLAEDTIDILKISFKYIHEWKPDFVAIWNINFDIPKILEMCAKYEVDPRDILCDPSIPREFQICKYKEGPAKQTTASGKAKPINPANRWHTLTLSASFYVIDAMCVYRRIRLSDAELPSYSLDSILRREEIPEKLKIPEVAHLKELKFHVEMQSKYKAEYIAYAIWDVYSMLLLDRKTKDLEFTLPSSAGNTDFGKFNSLPTRITDAFFYYALEEKNFVIGTVGETKRIEAVSGEEVADFDGSEDEEEVVEDEILSLRSWINQQYKSLY